MDIRILLSIEYNIYRNCLKNTLEKYENIYVTGEVCFFDDVENALLENGYDIIITDMHVNNNICVDNLLNNISVENGIRIIALLQSNDISRIKGISLDKFDGVVSLLSEVDKLVKSIYIVNNKGRYIDECFEQKFDKSSSDGINLLTKREIEVLKLIAMGCFNKEIASKMGITERTVKNHVTNIFKKIDVCDRTQAAIYAIRNNIIIL